MIRDGELIERHKAPRLRVARSSLPCPAIRPDGMEAIRNHADGRMYDSKSGYYRAVKQAGCEIVGDDPSFGQGKPPDFDSPGEIESDIKTAIEQLEARV